jgi:6-phosphogluconolactonase/glucosamine-6-phosphate isomerase/deaminase
MKIKNFKTTLELIDYVNGMITDLNQTQDTVNLAISGGKTPFEMFKIWKNEKILNYRKTKIWQVDERYIGQDSNLSNAGETLRLFNDKKFAELFQTVDTTLSYEDCVNEYDYRLMGLMKDGEEINIAFLGFGTDGHFGSVFHGDDMDYGESLVTGTNAKDPYPVVQRITMTPNLIGLADKIVVILTGVEKKTVLEEFLDGDLDEIEFPCKIWKDIDNVEIVTCF